MEIIANLSWEQIEQLELRLGHQVFVKSKNAKLFPVSNEQLKVS